MEGKIYSAIASVMKEVGAVGKNSRNDNGKYNYRSIDAVMNALNPVLAKNGVFTVPQIMESFREERTSRNGGTLIFSVLKVKYIFYADDGSNIEAIVTGEAMDTSDKSINKALSAAYKYACFQVFCIPTEEMLDSERDNPELGESKMTPKSKTLFDKINSSEIFTDDEVFLIGTKDVKGKRFKEVKNREAFLRFLNHIATQEYKFEDSRMQEQFLRLKTLQAELSNAA